MRNKIDHVVIGASALEQGRGVLKRKLGIEIPRGGKHDAMSTHNCVVQTGNNSFLELIAVDPEAPDPGRTRWFSLDSKVTQTRLGAAPRALCWVVSTQDLDATVAASPVDLGEVLHLSRGDLSWRLTVPQNGSLPEDGLLPAFIEWPPGPHPSQKMEDLGVRIIKIQLGHPQPEKLSAMLKALNADHLAEIHKSLEPAISFLLYSPEYGEVEIT